MIHATEADQREAVLCALRAAAVLPSPDEYGPMRDEIAREGRARYGQLIALVGERLLRQALSSADRPLAEQDCARVLGFGDALTRFVLSPLPIPAAEREAIVQLGVMANLLVSLYDHFVDLGVPGERLMRSWVLRRAIEGHSVWPLRVTTLLASPPSRLLARLTSTYLYQLDRRGRPFARAELQRSVRRIIWRMYEAERATTNVPAARDCVLRRKAALPFVLMGLPGWLVVRQSDAALFGWHVRWLYRLGEFFGLIDDFVDLEEDRAAGHGNRIDLRTRMFSDPFTNVTAAALAADGVRLMAEWQHRTAGATQLPAHVRGVVGVCAASWFGGVQHC